MPLYSIDVKLYATAYIRARSADEALKIARGLKDSSPAILDHEGDVLVSGARFSDPELPDVSLSPAMTIHGPDRGARPDLAE